MDSNPEATKSTPESATDTQVVPEQPVIQPLSKKAQKRAAKAAYLAEQKKERRAAEKERRKEKKRVLAAKRAAGELDEEEEARLSKKRRTGDGPKRPFNARVVVDLGFDDKMTENEVKSLTSQLAYTYSANRKADQPFEHLLFTSLNGRTQARLEGMSNAAYKRWTNAEFWSEDYKRLWKQSVDGETSRPVEGEPEGAAQVSAHRGALPVTEGEAHNREKDVAEQQHAQLPSDSKRRNLPSSAPKDTIIYLTADSQDELTELKEGETYIIGGIVDHNRYKNLCFNKAEASGIRSARLPIGTYLASLKTRKVLTVNQTFEILLKWVETRDWEQALEAVIPKRKFNEGRKRGTRTESDTKSEENVVDDADMEATEVVVSAAGLEDAEQVGERESTTGVEPAKTSTEPS